MSGLPETVWFLSGYRSDEVQSVHPTKATALRYYYNEELKNWRPRERYVERAKCFLAEREAREEVVRNRQRRVDFLRADLANAEEDLFTAQNELARCQSEAQS